MLNLFNFLSLCFFLQLSHIILAVFLYDPGCKFTIEDSKIRAHLIYYCFNNLLSLLNKSVLSQNYCLIHYYKGLSIVFCKSSSHVHIIFYLHPFDVSTMYFSEHIYCLFHKFLLQALISFVLIIVFKVVVTNLLSLNKFISTVLIMELIGKYYVSRFVKIICGILFLWAFPFLLYMK